MANAPTLTVEQLRQILSYDPETGALAWLERPVDLFIASGSISAATRQKQWNRRLANKPAFTAKDRHGYHTGTLLNIKTKAHRVAYALHYGEWPCSEVDHINGDPSDNRVVNLRIATHAQNLRNARSREGATSRFLGVSWHKRGQKWIAMIRRPEQSYLGLFESEEAAARAYDSAARAHHGAFARLNFPETAG